jgi:rare lipoprotein A
MRNSGNWVLRFCTSAWRGLKNNRQPLGAALFMMGVLGLMVGCATTGGGDGPPDEEPDLSGIEDAVPKVEPRSRYGNPKSYVVFGKRYYTRAHSGGYVEKGLASWYGKKFHGRRTSSGERYNMYGMTAAHKTLPLPTYAQVTNLKNGRRVVVRVNDRGPFHGGRVIDLSYAAARKLGVVKTGTAMVEVRAIDPRNPASGRNKDKFVADQHLSTRVAKAAPVRKAPSSSKGVASSPGEETSVRMASAASPGGSQASGPAGSEPRIAVASKASLSSVKSAMYLQVGAFGSRSNAEQLRRQLIEHLAENVQVRTVDMNQAPLYKVHVGPLNSRLAASDVSEKLAALGHSQSHVVME